MTDAEEAYNPSQSQFIGELQRVDSTITLFRAAATHVVLYNYQKSDSSWVRSGVEGTCFVCERSTQPRISIIILGQSGSENWQLTVKKLKVQLSRDKYIFIK
ncbi:mRNA-decapping enzyme subunit 1, partial [Kipferlia bialata]|eukprot:g8699.t1